MKKRFLSLLLLLCVVFGTLAGCSETPVNSGDSSSNAPVEKVDYAAQVSLDMNTPDTLKLPVTVKLHIDGDTTHFYFDKNANVPEDVKETGFLKARYQAVNTPESTGTIEPWGKAASDFTKDKLKNATSIVLETDTAKWDFDGNGRYLVWVWYKTNGSDTYRNLNVELLQEGYAWGSKISNIRYATVCNSSITMAKALAQHVYSKEKDPGFYYGAAKEIDLKELRTNIDAYVGQRIAFEGVVALYQDYTIYVQEYDVETGLYYGISVFYGYYDEYHNMLAPGNRVRIVGNVTNSDGFGYQVSSLKYNKMKPKDPDNIQMLAQNQTITFVDTSLDTFQSKVTLVSEAEGAQAVEYPYAQLAMDTAISMKNLKVVSTYTTSNGGNNDGAISITCKDESGKTVVVRTGVLRNPDQTIVTADIFKDKTITVRGIIGEYEGSYQIQVFTLGAIKIH